MSVCLYYTGYPRSGAGGDEHEEGGEGGGGGGGRSVLRVSFLMDGKMLRQNRQVHIRDRKQHELAMQGAPSPSSSAPPSPSSSSPSSSSSSSPSFIRSLFSLGRASQTGPVAERNQSAAVFAKHR